MTIYQFIQQHKSEIIEEAKRIEKNYYVVLFFSGKIGSCHKDMKPVPNDGEYIAVGRPVTDTAQEEDDDDMWQQWGHIEYVQ